MTSTDGSRTGHSRLDLKLPAWRPPQPPEMTPPARTAAWASRIGAPGAIFLGKIRPRVIGALISVLFIPVGAVRTLIGLRSPQSATDPWGPADAFVILAALAGVVALMLFIQSARSLRTKAAHSAQVILRQGNPGISQAQISAVLGSPAKFDQWAQTAGIAAMSSNAVAVSASDEGARLLFAKSTRGTPDLWRPRFGESLSRAFQATRVQAWIGIVLVMSSVVLAGSALVVWVIAARLARPLGDLSALGWALVAMFVAGWVFIAIARYGPRGRNSILDVMVSELSARDPKVTRAMAGAMLARPYMYDMWVLKHPEGGALQGDPVSGDSGNTVPPDRLGRTSLHYAALSGAAQEVERAVAAGADVNAPDADGFTPLHFAAQSNAIGAAEKLIALGADVDPVNKFGNSPLWVAVMNANDDGGAIPLLLKNGADPFLTNHYGHSPIETARRIANRDVAAFFGNPQDPSGSIQR